MPTEFAAGEKVTAAKLNRAVEKIIARGRRTTSSSTTTTIVGVLRLDDVVLASGYSYRVVATGLNGLSSVTGDTYQVTSRYTTDGSTPATTSPVLPGAVLSDRHQLGATVQAVSVLETEYEATSAVTFSVLLCIARLSGSGNVSLSVPTDGAIDLKIVNDGLNVGDTGTDI